MCRSKLEMYIDILKALTDHGPLKSTHLMYKVNINYKVLKDYLAFLTEQGLIEEKILENNKFAYTITQKGRVIIESFEKLKEMLPITEEFR